MDEQTRTFLDIYNHAEEAEEALQDLSVLEGIVTGEISESMGVVAEKLIDILQSVRYAEWGSGNGYCSCGARWIHFDCDSQGGDGWECERCGRGFWSSWIRPKNIYYGTVKGAT